MTAPRRQTLPQYYPVKIKIPANRKAMYMIAAKENIPKYASAAAS